MITSMNAIPFEKDLFIPSLSLSRCTPDVWLAWLSLAYGNGAEADGGGGGPTGSPDD